MKFPEWCCWLCGVLVWGIAADFAVAQPVDPGAKFCGAHTRVVWVQDHSSQNSDVLAVGQQLKLLGYDSADGRGERVIQNALRNYCKPLLTTDGSRIVCTDLTLNKMFVVDWDGKNRRILGNGFALDVWRDPETGAEWVYAATRAGKPGDGVHRDVRRFRIDDPTVSEPVWSQTQISCDNFQLSANGRWAAGEFPWPNGGLADLQAKSWRKLEQGCWASIAPDNSGLSWVFDGPHRQVVLHRPDQDVGWKVRINDIGDGNDNEMFHPRWSNHVRYFTQTGPYRVQGPVNLISGGGPQVEIFVSRFSPDFQRVEATWQVTRNQRGDFYPDVWISGGELARVEIPGLQQPDTLRLPVWPPTRAGLRWSLESGRLPPQLWLAPDQPGVTGELHARGHAFLTPEYGLWGSGGTFVVPRSTATPQQESAVWTLTALLAPSGPLPELPAAALTLAQSPTDFLQVRIGAKNIEIAVDSPGNRERQWWGLPTPALEKEPVWQIVLLGSRTPADRARQPPTLLLNGKVQKLVLQHDRSSPSSDASAWLTLGSPDWKGVIRQVAFYDQHLSRADQQALHIASKPWLKPTKIAQIRIMAERIEAVEIPDPAALLPYQRALGVQVYRVVKVLDGECSDQELLVAHWAVLDQHKLPLSDKIGEPVELRLEAITDHPELDGERQLIDTERTDLPLYYEVNFAASAK